MNWLPYNNEIETNYYSVLGLETELAPAGPLGPPSANGSTARTDISDYADTAVAQSRILPSTSLSPGSAVTASPQLSMSSDRTILGDLYATSSNGARRPCTAKSKQLFPPLGIQRSKHLPSISSDPTLQDASVRLWGFPDLRHLIIEETEDYHPEPILTVSTYDKIYEAFTQICFDSAPFGNQYTSTEFPSLKILDYCVKLFFEHFNHIFPLVHPHLTNLDTSWVLALAICAVGSQYSATEEIDSCVLPLHEFLRRVLAIQLENSVLELPLAQALVLSQVSLLYYGTSQLRHTAYNRVGNLHEIINNFRRTSNLDFENAARARLDQTEADIQAEWILWVDRETWRRLCYFLWLLDRMASFFFNYHHASTFDVTDINLPHDGLWSLKSGLDWAAAYRQVEANPALATAANELFRERRAKNDLGEFSRILLLHAVHQEYVTVTAYFKRPLSSWIPRNSPELHHNRPEPLWSSVSNWRNAALDCVDTLHWAANATVASLLGAEHPTVLHLHFSRVVLLAPRAAIITLAGYFVSPDRLRKSNLPIASHQDALQAEREISEWAQQDGSKARLAVLHCGCFFWHIRRYAKMAFYEPPCVFWTTLTLWAYSVYSSKTRQQPAGLRSGSVTRQTSPDHTASFSDDTPTFIRLDRPNDDEMVQLFVRAGILKAYISGIGDIYASTAPKRIIQEGRRILETVSIAWGRRTEYLDFLQALEK
ncbi:hypothetical protein FDECE_4981 [Fusarium decemcellulare]|nr:hypothetical protein FDECE_4981 [Fusarium decemcellulare]